MTPETTIEILPQIGVPIERVELGDLRDRAMAACATAKDLAAFGLDLSTTEEDNELACILAEAYATDPEDSAKQLTPDIVTKQTPASLVLAGSILDEFGQLVVKNSVHLRHMVTNKLILEAENPDARVRLRALELLGKMSDVGLFTEKKEITVHHSSTDDLRASLKAKLSRLVNPGEETEIAEYEVID